MGRNPFPFVSLIVVGVAPMASFCVVEYVCQPVAIFIATPSVTVSPGLAFEGFKSNVSSTGVAPPG